MLKIKDNVDLKELEKFGFIYYTHIGDNNTTSKWHNGYEKYTEIGYRFDDGKNTIDVVEQRINANWFFSNELREIYIYENDYDVGVSKGAIEKLFELISAGIVDKVDEVN